MANQVNISGTTSGNNIKLDNVLLDVMSKEILFKAQPVTLFESIATKRTELQSQPGKTVTFLKYNALSGDPALVETTEIETAAMSTSTVQITVSEYAKAISVNELLLRTATTDVLRDAAQLLANHYAKYARDAIIRDKLLTGTNVVYANGSPDRAGIGSTEYFDVNLVREAVERLATAKAPKFGGDAYVCFVHPHQGRRLRSDSAWINASNYGAPGNLFTGEIGRIEDMRFIETTMVPYIPATTQDIWADGEDTNTNTAVAAHATVDIYRAVVVGEYAVGLAEALPVEMRDNGVEDFGRKHSIGYYGIWGCGLVESAHSLILETA